MLKTNSEIVYLMNQSPRKLAMYNYVTEISTSPNTILGYYALRCLKLQNSRVSNRIPSSHHYFFLGC